MNKFCGKLKEKGIWNVVVSGVFSVLDDSHEKIVAGFVSFECINFSPPKNFFSALFRMDSRGNGDPYIDHSLKVQIFPFTLLFLFFLYLQLILVVSDSLFHFFWIS